MGEPDPDTVTSATANPTPTNRRAPLHVLLCPVGSIGDLNPQLAIGAELKRRNHRVTILANERFAEACHSVADEFVAVQDARRLDELAADPRSFSYQNGYPIHIRVQCLDPMAQLQQALADRVQAQPAVVVASSWGFGARVAQERFGFPMLTVHTDPHTLRGCGVLRMPRPMIVGRYVPRWFMRLQWQIADRFFIDPLCRPELNSFRGTFALPPIRRVMDLWWNSPDGVLALFPDWWGPPDPEWPPQTLTTGFPVFDQGEREGCPPALEAFFTSGSPPVVYSPGNSDFHEPRHLAAVVEACRNVGCRVVLVTPRSDYVIDPDGRDVLLARYIPFQLLLQRARAIIHHAGTGTLAAALRAAIPQVSIPTIFNQPHSAERLRRLGVGQTVLPRHFSASRLTAALRHLLDGPQVAERCREIAARFGHPEEAATRSADRIEAIAKQRFG